MPVLRLAVSLRSVSGRCRWQTTPLGRLREPNANLLAAALRQSAA